MKKQRVKRKKKKLRLNYKRVFKVLLVLTGIILVIVYFCNLHIKRIKISGTKLISDKEIIEVAGIKDYPKMFSFLNKDIESKIKTIDLVSKVRVTKSMFGTLSIDIVEDRVLFYNDVTHMAVTSSNREIEDKGYLGVPKLTTLVSKDVYEEFVKALNKVDKDILSCINTIAYEPTTSTSGVVIDDKRFRLSMNDGNEVVVNTLNIDKLNNYFEVLETKNNSMGSVLGVFFFDSPTTNNTFQSFDSISKGELVADGETTKE